MPGSKLYFQLCKSKFGIFPKVFKETLQHQLVSIYLLDRFYCLTLFKINGYYGLISQKLSDIVLIVFRIMITKH